MSALIFCVLCSTLTTDDMLPEIEITAPRYSNQEADSVGMIPEIVIYGSYRTNYQNSLNHVLNYGILIIATIFILTFIIVVLVKDNHHYHILVPRHKEESRLHRWVQRHYDRKYGNWRN
jgi:hypothetical protein